MAALLAATVANPSIPLSMLVVFASAKLLAEVFERLGQPGIVGQILAGVLLGPAVLGWMTPNEVLHILSDLGVLFLLFRVGLEVKASEMIKIGGTAILVAVCGVAVPFGMGWGIAALWGEPHLSSVFLGAAMVATSVGITAQVLASKGLLETRAAKIILAAAVVDDVLGLIVLALVQGLARDSLNYVSVALTALVAIGFTLVVARFGTPAVKHVVPWLRGSLHMADGEFTLAMTLLFGLSVLAISAGVAAIVGAFLAGMALSETVHERVTILTSGVSELLVPFFLAGVGMQFDVSAFRTRSILVLAGLALVVAIVSKLVGCGLGALPLGRADALRVGVGMVPRGEVGMVVAQIGLRMGAMTPAIYGIVVFLSVATTMAAPPLLHVVFRGAAPAAAAAPSEDGSIRYNIGT